MVLYEIYSKKLQWQETFGITLCQYKWKVICHQIKKELKCFRSFKNSDQEKFTEDLNKIDFDKITDQNDVNKMY